MTPSARAELAAALGSEVAEARTMSGGDVSDAWRVTLRDGRALFVKTHAGADPEMFPLEAEGLAWLAEANAIRTPRVLAASASFLALELVEPGRRAPDFAERLGRELAALHRFGAEGFGWRSSNFIASLRQDNTPVGEWKDRRALRSAAERSGSELARGRGEGRPDSEREPRSSARAREGARQQAEQDWPSFYVRRRLEPMLRRATERGLASSAMKRGFARVFARIEELAGPAEPPSRLHGDLWSGNCHVGEDGAPVLIDPAVYGGHREVDLAMMQLFGGFSERTFDAYCEAWPLAAGWRERTPLYQLYPLLVHVVLFGESYAGAIERALDACGAG